MARELISLDRFREELREGKRPGVGVYRLQVTEPLLIAGAERTLRFCFSDGSVDRVGDTIDPEGWDVGAFLRNPVVLWAHDSFAPPIGKAANLAIEAKRLMGDVTFAPPEIYGFADLIFRLVKAKYLNAGSVGFLPIDYSFTKDKEREFGIDFERQELLEYSICPVPANPNALAEARAHGIDTRPLVGWAERLLDGEGRVVLPKTEVETMRTLAGEPYSRLRSAANWHCSGARDLPLDDNDSWDGPAAEKSIFEWAGGDEFDPAKARRGFLIYDAASPHLRGSYKLPFAHVAAGELKAVKGGIRAAASRLPQTDAPQSVLDDARKVVDHYEERFGMKTLRRDGMSETDPASGGYVANCGRSLDQECGLKNPEECAVHGPALAEHKGLARVLRHILPAILREAGVEPGEAPARLKRAREHVKAAYACHLAMDAVDDGVNPMHESEGHPDQVHAMHAHVKAADGYLNRYRGAGGKASAPPEGLMPEEHLRRAREHVRAAHGHMKDLVIIDPDGDEDLSGNDEAQDAVKGMHAHMKSADQYLEAYRSTLGDETGDPEAEKAARLARLRKLDEPDPE